MGHGTEVTFMTPDGVGDGILIEGELIVPAHPEIIVTVPDGLGYVAAMTLVTWVTLRLAEAGLGDARDSFALAAVPPGTEIRSLTIDAVMHEAARYVTLTAPAEG